MFDVDSLIAIHRLQLWASTDGPWKSKMEENRGTVFSRDVTAAMLVSLNKGTAAMLVSQTNPSGIELYSLYENVFFCFGWKNMLIDDVSENSVSAFEIIEALCW